MSPHAVIVGAGPAGSLMAILLANRGFHVDMYDKRLDLDDESLPPFAPAQTASPPAEASSNGTSKRQVVPITSRTFPIRLSSRGLDPLRFAGVLPGPSVMAPFSGVRHFQGKSVAAPTVPGHYLTNRNALTRFLAESAASHASGKVRVHFGWSLQSLASDGEAATFTRQWGEKEQVAGREKEVETCHVEDFDLLVGADGVRSSVRAEIARLDPTLSVCMETDPVRYIRFPLLPRGALLAEEPFSRFAPHALHFFIGPERSILTATTMPDGMGLLNLFFVDRPDYWAQRIKDPAELQAYLRSVSPPLLPIYDRHYANFASDFARLLQASVVNTQAVCTHFHWRRVVLLGDAAHAMYTKLGHGCNTALQSCQVFDQILGEELAGAAASEAGAAASEAAAAASDAAAGGRGSTEAPQQAAIPLNRHALRAAISCAVERFSEERREEVHAGIELSNDPPLPSIAYSTLMRLRSLLRISVLSAAQKIIPGHAGPRMLGLPADAPFTQMKREIAEDERTALLYVALLLSSVGSLAFPISVAVH